MTESEFNELADAVFKRIEKALDNNPADIDYDSNGMILEMEFENGSKLIINRHEPNREIWLAAKSGGFHFGYSNQNWMNHRDGSELYTKLGELVLTGSGEKILF